MKASQEEMVEAVEGLTPYLERRTGREVLLVLCVSRPKDGHAEITMASDKMQSPKRWLMDLRDEIDMRLSQV